MTAWDDDDDDGGGGGDDDDDTSPLQLLALDPTTTVSTNSQIPPRPRFLLSLIR